ncbi:MAG: hypothetical protein J7K15_06290 [Deltaproteobacteria bacterium]|nr:hypothetical protein [Deltaproteobacteria bacterium]
MLKFKDLFSLVPTPPPIHGNKEKRALRRKAARAWQLPATSWYSAGLSPQRKTWTKERASLMANVIN